jgi:ubiquinone/menaquinone biosynthesis C-methylase UbiE
MSTSETFQLSLDAAEAYESRFVPALFREWAGFLVEHAGVRPGQRVLDVACGTGIVARTAADLTGEPGAVTGLDLNDAMLTVARRLRPDIGWQQADAAELPFPDDSFDVVLCQSGLMFFPDVPKALSEMARVVVLGGGTVAVQVWDRRESQPAYAPFIEVAAAHSGPEALDLLSTYFNRGDLEELKTALTSVGLEVSGTRTETTTLRFPSVDAFVMTEVNSTPLAERLSDDVLRTIVEDSREALRSFGVEGGGVELPIRGHLVTARKG